MEQVTDARLRAAHRRGSRMRALRAILSVALLTAVGFLTVGGFEAQTDAQSTHGPSQHAGTWARGHAVTVIVRGAFPSTEDTDGLAGRGDYVPGKGFTYYVPVVLTDLYGYQLAQRDTCRALRDGRSVNGRHGYERAARFLGCGRATH